MLNVTNSHLAEGTHTKRKPGPRVFRAAALGTLALQLALPLVFSACGESDFADDSARSPGSPAYDRVGGGAAGSASVFSSSTGRSGATKSCGGLSGNGSYSNPHPIGTVSGTTRLSGCARLTSGDPFDVEYFSLSISATPGPGSRVGARFVTSGNESAVHPRLVRKDGGVTVLKSADGFSDASGRWLSIAGIAPGAYILGFEKLRSPLSSLETSTYDVEISLY
jgi:hypothetical protein